MPPTVADPVAQNIADVLRLENEERDTMSRVHRWLDGISRGLAQPAFPIGMLLLVAGWLVFNLAAGSRGFDSPPFHWLQGLLTLTALLTTAIVLAGQRRQARLAEQRAHMDLQINMLTEQKVSKLIHLIEELRADLPGVRERHDPLVVQLKKPTDPARLASALKERAAARSAPRQSRERRRRTSPLRMT